MAITGKTGADAIFKALKRICIVLTKYQAKLQAVVIAAETAGAISAADATTINAFITVAGATCSAFDRLSQYSGF